LVGFGSLTDISSTTSKAARLSQGPAAVANRLARPRSASARERNDGAVAQLGEHLLCKQGVSGSIPLSSTNSIGVELNGLSFEEVKVCIRRHAVCLFCIHCEEKILSGGFQVF
jgi:hypothetical protein